MAILRDMAHAGGRALADGSLGDVLAVQDDFTLAERLQAGQAIDQLRLTIAVDARDANDLPAVHGEGHILHGVVVVRLRGHGHMAHFQHGLAGGRRLLLHMEVDVAPHHHGG